MSHPPHEWKEVKREGRAIHYECSCGATMVQAPGIEFRFLRSEPKKVVSVSKE